MARLYLFAEGQTEQTFADSVLKPHLANFAVYLQNSQTVANRRSKGKVHRGGGMSYTPMRDDIHRRMKQEKNADVYFTTMIDLYALYSDFPGREKADRLRHNPSERVERLEEAFAIDLGDPRFLPFIQLHEFEAYLFADPAGFAISYENAEKAIVNLQAIADSYATPELINDSPHTAPSKRIIAELPNYKKAKVEVGPQVAAWIGLATIRAKCPHFNAWLTRLESLGGEERSARDLGR